MIVGAVVVDASVVVEFLVRLRWPDEAQRLFEAAGDGDVELIAPDLVFLESTSALRKLVLCKAIDARAGGRALDMLAKLPIRAIAVQQFLADIWAWRDSVTPYDAAYAALAKHTKAPLVTGDDELVAALRRKPLRVIALAQLGSV